ncbi:MAG: hypothetical protein RIS36_1170 [Pseudomonadota bacterium]|jgi:hypothetical protein
MMKPDKDSAADQKTTIERLLDDEQVLVHINPSTDGVVIPPHLSGNKTVTLRLSRFFKGDLSLDDEKVTAELLFGPEYFTCILPWDCIWGASSIRGQEYLWAESAPDEILQMFLSQRDERRTIMSRQDRYMPPPAMKPRRTATHLRRVK